MPAGYEFLGENAGARGHWDDTLAFGAKDRELGEKTGSLARVAWSSFCDVQAWHGKGELGAAHAAASTAIELCERIGEVRLATWLVPAKALVEADMGDEQAARESAEEGWTLAKQLDQRVLSAWALHAAGYAAMRRGDIGASLEWYERYAGLVADTENRVAPLLVGPCAAEAFLLAGRLDEAARLCDDAERIAAFAGAPFRVALARRVKARTLAAMEKHDEALRLLDEAISMFERGGSRLEWARASCDRAALRMRHGDASERAAARTDIANARDAFDTMGAATDRARAERLLADTER